MKRQSPLLPGTRRSRVNALWKVLALLAFLFVPPALPHLLSLKVPPPPSGPADAIFVLTGDEGRIREGYRAWAAGAARELYILGAGSAVRVSRLVPEAGRLTASDLSRIHVEGWSENTLENAFSAKSVVSERKFTSAILVTSDYHIPRAYIAFRKVLPPGVSLSAIRVHGERAGAENAAWRRARRHYIEGWKYWGYRILLRWE